jgi:cysteine desulfurase/selenocysteine lyase
MLGPEGAGIFYLKQSHLDLLRPVMVGWNSVERPFDFDQINWQPRPTATRFEGGSNNMVGLIGLGASLSFLKELGLTSKASPIAEQILDYITVARTALADLGAELFGPEDRAHQSGILSFGFPGKDLSRVRQRCMDNRVVLSCRAGRLRISPHAYNNQDDLDRLLNVLTDCSNA